MDTIRLHPTRRRDGSLLVAALLLTMAVARAAAPPGPQADVWVASTRRLPGICRMPEHAALDIERLSGGDRGRWERACIDEMLAADDRPLAIFVHGNRYTPGEAKSQGLEFARLVAANCPDAGPVRTIVFSWPSAQEGVLLRDVRAKYDRAHADGHYLAWLLGRVEPERPVAIVGFSFGALVGLHALRDLESATGTGGAAWPGRPGRTNLVFVAPAVRCDALAPRGPYRAAIAGVDRFTIVANSADCALGLFPCVDRDVRTEALGATAMPRRWLPADVEYCAIDAADIVGVRHRLPLYLGSAPLARRIATGAVAGFDQAVGP